MTGNNSMENSAANEAAAAVQAAKGGASAEAAVPVSETPSRTSAAREEQAAASAMPMAPAITGVPASAGTSAQAGKPVAAVPAATWYDVIGYEDLPAGTGKTVRIGALELALFRFTSGRVHAIQNRCPHKDGVLAEGIVSGEFVFCPMHDRKIHVPSGEVQKPDDGCVRTYDAKVEGGRVLIAVPNAVRCAG